ncbi:hypothetical protein LTR10_017175 [Elasticomyces elasticus]|uniref:VOC domain-containing protein n=1 Tax=Exophiala sideris TaxID=1016849 RepID=A0ABR0J5W5_9EURO|nr:hypothetical protein LTR10_017175 [Elasticomyces elasticus]KAK5028469.1 hypothetical protein LTS07_006560 [Exophiala sideris]KAK5035889.1 hypothetical protein LTR13_005459 [Exophiala sideris]KAK5056925.1 hypothetical protein LTR69_007563 [Exophiala sideris]KAK5181332.1 hypothetical protein LTR44_006127 [Eurotiomycetes sp. CCFEE 6388]
MPLDHVLLRVPCNKFDAEVSFITSAFGHMDIKEFVRFPNVIGLGEDHPWFWISGVDENQNPIPDDAQDLRLHLALRAKDRGQVDTFYAEALKAGGTNNGAPENRAMYGPNYYGAFVISPAGHNIEAVIR